MTGIWELDDSDVVSEWVHQAVQQVAVEFADSTGLPTEALDNIRTEEIFVVGKWGRGTAEPGEDELELAFIVDVDEVEGVDVYEEIAVPIIEAFGREPLWRGEVIDHPPQVMLDLFEGINLFRGIWRSEQKEQAINFHVGREEPHRIYSLTTDEILTVEDIVPDEDEFGMLEMQEMLSPDEFSQVQAGEAELADFVEGETEIVRKEPPTDEPEETEPEPDDEDEEPEPDVIDEDDRFSENPEFFDDMPPVLTPFAREADSLAVPAGSEYKKVEPRELYDFEVAMGHSSPDMPRDNPDLQGLEEGVGFRVAMGDIGHTVPASTFPRTGLYVKNRLLHEGPGYILEIYNDLVLYSAYISSLHDMKFSPGSYTSFRNFMGRLNRYGEQEGNERLVIRMAESDAASRGFDLIPDHPTIEGEKAPWLENRQYYQIEEDNADSKVWDNITEEMYGED